MLSVTSPGRFWGMALEEFGNWAHYLEVVSSSRDLGVGLGRVGVTV